MQTMGTLLPYILPPLLGAFIGYLTNTIAIRMLFRPLRPWRVFGLRVPLTPGIIPAKRFELAERMGEMVGEHLLTADDVGRVLERESFKRELRTAVTEKLGNFLDRDLGPVVALVPEAYRGRFDQFVELLRWKASRAVFDYLDSPECAERLRGFLDEKGHELLARDLESFLPPRRYAALENHLQDRIRAALQSGELAGAVAALVDARLERLLESRRPVRELLPEDLVEVLLDQMEKEIPPLLERFGGMLYDPAFRERLVKKAKEGIEHYLDSLSGLSGLLSGFINLEKLYARIPEFLDRTGDEISRWLREEKTQRQVAAILRERVARMLERSPADIVEGVSYEKIAEVRRFARERTVEALRGARTEETVLGIVRRGIEKIKDQPFGVLLDRVAPAGGADRLLERFGDELLRQLRSPRVHRAVEAFFREQTGEWLYRRPVGKLSARVAGDVREELETELHRQVGELLKREIPPLVESLNVRRMVEEKVNSLDILKVEGLLMGIMREQFKYINLFGGLLGFLIGLANLLVFLLG